MAKANRVLVKAEAAVVWEAMREHHPWSRKYAECVVRVPKTSPLYRACARLYLARLNAACAPPRRKGARR